MSNAGQRTSEHLYRLLLQLYPKRYREEFGEEMHYVFSESLKDAYTEHGEPGILLLWWRTLLDAGKSLVTQHLANQKEKGSMKTRSIQLITHNRNILIIILATALLLMVPLIAMQFTKDVVWGPFDFVVAGVLLLGTGLTFELIARRGNSIVYRLAVAVATGTALFLVWANLAVGVIGNESEPANLMYIGVLAVGIIGAIVARFQPQGMARALFATALAQAVVTVIALLAGMQNYPESSIFEILSVNVFFIVLWVAAALLFLRAGVVLSKQS